MVDISLQKPASSDKKFFSTSRAQRNIALGYLAFLTLAEALTTLIEPRVGLVMHGLLLLALFVHASFWDHGRLRGFLLSLAMAPLIRLLSLSLPLPSFPFIYWYMVVGAPLLIAALVAAQIGRINRRMLGLTLRKIPAQLLIATAGIVLGYLEYRILHPDPLIPELRLELVWIPALILLIFTGFLEEYVFRGLMQYTSMRSFGRFGFYYVAVVFAVLHLGYHSALDVVFVLVVALFFGWAAQRTGSIFGVTLAHGLTNIGLFLIFPFVAVALPGLPAIFPAQIPAATQPAQAPGLLAPLGTLEATRPWMPPAATQAPITPTSPVVTETSPATFTPTLEATSAPGATETPLIPEASPTCAPRRDWVPYVVQPGDTLFGIAERAGLSLDELLLANCYTSFKIYSGQVLYMPFRLSIPTAKPSPVVTETATDTPVPLPTALPTDTPTMTDTPTETPTDTPTATPTDTPVPVDTSTPTETLTP